MSRSEYSDGLDQWDLIRWRGAVLSALRGRRGQAFLREMLVSLDSLPHKRLITGYLQNKGEVCAIGSVGISRGLDLDREEGFSNETLSVMFGIAEAMVREIAFINDEYYSPETSTERFNRMRCWVVQNINEQQL